MLTFTLPKNIKDIVDELVRTFKKFGLEFYRIENECQGGSEYIRITVSIKVK